MSAGTGDKHDEHRRATSAVLDQTAALTRLVAAFRSQKERSAHLLLYPMGRLGPMRQSALADLAHLDPSTASRHVTDLVAAGLVERHPDPDDRRASLLALTPAGTDALAASRRERDERAASVLDDWTAHDLTTFCAALTRFTDDLGGLLTATRED